MKQWRSVYSTNSQLELKLCMLSCWSCRITSMMLLVSYTVHYDFVAENVRRWWWKDGRNVTTTWKLIGIHQKERHDCCLMKMGSVRASCQWQWLVFHISMTYSKKSAQHKVITAKTKAPPTSQTIKSIKHKSENARIGNTNKWIGNIKKMSRQYKQINRQYKQVTWQDQQTRE